ncbi:phage tail protein [Mediterraneibacter glycyrrhizinilyticus]|uniref:phage tail spike protein n=1 Tax=Mediterraneibacter glycyrrhizinilyticus TaxID=342942 RepID=UPI0026586DD8|nr:phage tail spike protein [Mediterraneibacter glycyrrhizinilyticus]MCF2569547.1 phage tail protein [Mediterraneibacter glycyrrhizinilyticus]
MFKIYADDVLFYDDRLQNDDYKVSNPVLTMELNKAGSLTFTLPQCNVVYDTLEKLKTTIHVYDGSGSEIWRGRILNDEKDFYNQKHVYCEGALAFLADGIIRPYKWSGSVQAYFRSLVSKQFEEVEAGRQFWYKSTENALEDANEYIVRSNSNYAIALNEISEKLLNNLGGYLNLSFGVGKTFDRIYISYDSTSGKVSNQIIEFGKSLLDITEYITAENIFTVLIPLGAKITEEDESEENLKRLTIEDVNNGLDYIQNDSAVELFGKIWRTNTWDDVTIPANLYAKGVECLENNISLAVTLSIKAIDLHLLNVDTERIKLGDSIRVVSKPHGLDAFFHCSKVVLKFQNPESNEYTLGVGFASMTDHQVQAQKASQNAFTVTESIQSHISQIGVNIAGNYVTKSEFSSFQSQVNNNFTAVNNKLTSVFHYKGTQPSESNLPTEGNTVGDVWNVSDTDANYAWNGSSWDKLSETITVPDLSNYVTIETYRELLSRVEALEAGSTVGITQNGSVVTIPRTVSITAVQTGDVVELS